MGKPVVGLGTWELHQGGRPLDAVREARSPEEAVSVALELLRAEE
jgi:hypothetical protein